jgi:1-acyl-sn-glycerol-3-phosphate acyltransferase
LKNGDQYTGPGMMTHNIDNQPGTGSHAESWGVSSWKRFCWLVVRVFYRRFEVSGEASIPTDTGLILCANHVNALVDAVVMQAATDRLVRPLARSGLFKNPVLWPLLHLIGAVPVYRRQDQGSNTSRNTDSFSRCYQLLAEGECLIIFPEGQSHSDSHLHDLKTGAARIALGAIQANGRAPVVLPVGLMFTRKGRPRGDVLVQYGQPVALDIPAGLSAREAVELLTTRITQGLADVTLNADSWQEIDLATRVEKFFAFRHGRYRKKQLAQQFRAVQRLVDGQHLLLEHEPDRVRALIRHLHMFERLRNCCGIGDYQLTLNYRPTLIALYMLRTLLVLLIGFPVALWGAVNSILPFQLTHTLSRLIAKGEDQYDTARILLGMLLFGLFWSLQCAFVYYHFGGGWMLAYLGSLLVSTPVALMMRSEYRYALGNLRVFFLFLRKHELKEYLLLKRVELETELARLVRITRRLSHAQKL